MISAAKLLGLCAHATLLPTRMRESLRYRCAGTSRLVGAGLFL